MDIVKLAINNARLTITTLVFLMIVGAMSYLSIPKEAEPDVPVPIISGHLAGGFRAAASAPGRDAAQDDQGRQGDAFGRL
jgi:Na+-transporting methylmalonyl-CoA/oxaloacetate decarboxylase beta subunit